MGKEVLNPAATGCPRVRWGGTSPSLVRSVGDGEEICKGETGKRLLGNWNVK